MTMDAGAIADRIEKYLREQFSIAEDDPGFTRTVDLYESGYVDSVGVVELLSFIDEEFGVDVPEPELLSPGFSNIDGIARIVDRLIEDGA
jgi:acyl carrier protein